MFRIVYNNIYFQIIRTTLKTKFKQLTQGTAHWILGRNKIYLKELSRDCVRIYITGVSEAGSL